VEVSRSVQARTEPWSLQHFPNPPQNPLSHRLPLPSQHDCQYTERPRRVGRVLRTAHAGSITVVVDRKRFLRFFIASPCSGAGTGSRDESPASSLFKFVSVRDLIGRNVVGVRRRQSTCQFPDPEVVLRRNAECVRDAVEKCEHCGDVDSFRNLFFFPARVSKFLHIFCGRAIGSVRDQLDVIQQRALRRSKARFVKFALDDGFYTLIRRSLDTQEVGVAVQSIGTTIQIGDIARD
jgi:hypothetical protein